MSQQKLIEASEKILDVVRAFCYRKSEPRSVIMCGPSGCGKTHLSTHAYQFCKAACMTVFPEFYANPPSAHMISWSRFNHEALTSEAMVADARDNHFLVVDDIGSETDPFKNQKATEFLYRFIDERNQPGKYTIYTTNILPKDWGSRWDQRVADRLTRNGGLVVNLAEVSSYRVRRRA